MPGCSIKGQPGGKKIFYGNGLMRLYKRQRGGFALYLTALRREKE